MKSLRVLASILLTFWIGSTLGVFWVARVTGRDEAAQDA